jgi:hypothetical protein
MRRTKRDDSAIVDGKMIADTEPIFVYLMSILDNKSHYNRYVLPKHNNRTNHIVHVGVNIQTINSVDEKQRVNIL